MLSKDEQSGWRRRKKSCPQAAFFVQAARSVARFVHQLVGLDPRHHGAQLLAHDFNGVLGVEAAATLQRGRARLVFQNETLGVFAGLDVLERLAHGVFRGLGHHARAGDVFAVFGVVRKEKLEMK